MHDRKTKIQREIGAVLWELQALEETLARLVAVVFKMPANASLEQARDVLGNARSATLGQLVSQIKSYLPFDKFGEIFLRRLVEQRNWLIHRSYRTHSAYLQDEEQYVELRYRLARLSSDAKEFNSLFLQVITEWAEKQGVTSDEIEQLAAEVEKVQFEA